jgi:O-methyltransferase involved in polyketide biosynthesis
MRDLDWVPANINVNEANPARVHDHHLGGWHNFPADRWAARSAVDGEPGLPTAVLANRGFLQRTVRHLLSLGVRQFLDLGSGLPTAGHVHEVAHALDPTTRVVYVDVDPTAVAHGQRIVRDAKRVAMVCADLRSVPQVLAAPGVRRLIDFTAPVGVLMVGVLQLVPDSSDPAGVIDRYREAVAAESHLVLSHPGPAAVWDPSEERRAEFRTKEEVTALFGGWELVGPGVTEVAQWYATGTDTLPGDRTSMDHFGGVARKP